MRNGRVTPLSKAFSVLLYFQAYIFPVKGNSPGTTLSAPSHVPGFHPDDRTQNFTIYVKFRIRLSIYVILLESGRVSDDWSGFGEKLNFEYRPSDRGQFSARSNFLPAGKTFYRDKERSLKDKNMQRQKSVEVETNVDHPLNFFDNDLERVMLPFDPSLSRFSLESIPLENEPSSSRFVQFPPLSLFFLYLRYLDFARSIPNEFRGDDGSTARSEIKGMEKRKEDSDSRY